jgi:hypothetical protein
MRLFKILPGILLILLLVMGCGERSGISTIDGRSLDFQDVNATVSGLMDRANVTGLCLAVLNDNQVSYVRSYGFRNREKEERLSNDTRQLSEISSLKSR